MEKLSSEDQVATGAAELEAPASISALESLTHIVESEATAPPTNGAKSNDKLTVSRFLIQNIQGGRGYATADYSIEFIREKHGLYDLVSAVFGIMWKEKLTQDDIYSHLWNVTFEGTTCSVLACFANPVEGTYDRSPTSGDIDEGESRIFSSLAVPLAKGQKGSFSGSSANFDFVVDDAAVGEVDESDIVVTLYSPWGGVQKSEDDKDKEKKDDKNASSLTMTNYPKCKKVASQLSGSMDSDWIASTETKTKCLRLSNAWFEFFQGLNSWKRDRRTLGWLPTKPQSPPWNVDEITIIGLLLNSDSKFKKSWTNILQYAFLNRTESATSMKWYLLKGKESYRIEHYGRGMTNENRIKLAKRLARKNMLGLFDIGTPKKDPHPNARLESQLRKHGIIDDGTDDFERKRLCVQYRGIFD